MKYPRFVLVQSLLVAVVAVLPLFVRGDEAAAAAASQSAPAPSPEWRVPEAEYRLTVTTTEAGKPGFLDLRRLILPSIQGVKVCRPDGTGVPFRRNGNDTLAVAPSDKADSVYEIYLGFQEIPPADQWGSDNPVPCPTENRLRLTIFPGGGQVCTPEQYLQARLNDIERSTRWHRTHMPRRTYRLLMALGSGTRLLNDLPGIGSIRRERQTRFRQLIHPRRGTRNYAALELSRPAEMADPNRPENSWKRQLVNHFNWTKQQLEQIAARQQQARKDAPRGCFRELEGLKNSRRWQQEYPASEVQLVLRPPETPEYYSARFSALLPVSEAGKHEFELNTNSLTLLRVAGQELLAVEGDGSGADVHRTAEIELPAGNHEFELCFRVNRDAGRMTLRLRRPGDTEFHPLTADDVVPAPRLRPVKLEGRDGKRYPLVERHNPMLLYPDKQTHYEMAEIRLLEPSGDDVEWRLGTKNYSTATLPKLLFLPLKGETGFSIHPRIAGWNSLMVPPSGRYLDQVPLRPDLSMKLWLPHFLYDNEVWNGVIELNSKLPLPLDAELTLTPTRPTSEFPESRTQFWHLPEKPDERFDRFAADVIQKRPLLLDGEELGGDWALNLRLWIPDFEFDNKTVRVLPVNSEEAFFWTPEGFVDRTGATVILYLHAPTLNELRSWELPRKVGNELQPLRKVLFLGEEVGDGEKSLAELLSGKLAAHGIELEHQTASRDWNTLLASLPQYFKVIGESDADTAWVLLPCRRHRSQLEGWEQERATAALLECLRGNSKLKKIYIAILPLYEESPLPDPLAERLPHLAREYDVHYQPLTLPAREGTNGASHFERHTHPEEAAEFLACEIFEKLTRRDRNELEKEPNDEHIMKSSASAR